MIQIVTKYLIVFVNHIEIQNNGIGFLKKSIILHYNGLSNFDEFEDIIFRLLFVILCTRSENEQYTEWYEDERQDYDYAYVTQNTFSGTALKLMVFNIGTPPVVLGQIPTLSNKLDILSKDKPFPWGPEIIVYIGKVLPYISCKSSNTDRNL